MDNNQQHTIHKTKAFFSILLLALILRLIWAFYIPVIPVSDSAMYDVFALSISQGNGYAFPQGNLTAYWPVGTSAIYGALYYLFGHTYTAIVTFNLFISLLTTALIMLLAERWINIKSAFYAGIIFALWPSQIQFNTVLASELIFNTLLLLGLFFWPTSVKNKYASLIIAATFLAFATYVRPIALLIPFILITLDFIRNKNLSECITSSICVLLTMFVLISPWTIRNHHVFGHTVLISTNGAPVLWMGNNPDSDGGYMALPEINFNSEVERSQYFKQQAIEHISAEPVLFLKRCFARLIDYYKSETIGVHWNIDGIKQVLSERWSLPLKLISTSYWSVILLFSVFGSYYWSKETGIEKNLSNNPVLILILYFTVIHTIIASGDRYHFPIIPFLAILSGSYLGKIMPSYLQLSRLKQQP